MGTWDQSAHSEIFGNGECREDLPSLRNLADPEIADLMAWPSGNVRVPINDPAARGLVHPRYGADERALAGAIGADDRNDSTLLDLDPHTVECLRAGMIHIETFGAQPHPNDSTHR